MRYLGLETDGVALYFNGVGISTLARTGLSPTDVDTLIQLVDTLEGLEPIRDAKEEGYREAEEERPTTADFEEGRDAGYDAGYQDGFNEADERGDYSDGYDKGHKVGFEEGHEEGFSDGEAAGRKSETKVVLAKFAEKVAGR